MNVKQYLQRIGLTDVNSCDIATLGKLQQHHMYYVPFENLDVINDIPIQLDIESYYEKIVVNNRGGFCYELNGLFNWLLQQIGYRTSLVAASVKRADGSWSLHKASHACLLVHLDIPYLVDVGFGDSVRNPLPLTGETEEDVSGIYRLRKLNATTFDLQRKADKWETLFRLETTPRQLGDYKEACHFNQTSPDSIFTQKEIVSLAEKNGRVTLSNDRLIITGQSDKIEIKINANEREEILKKYFNIKE